MVNTKRRIGGTVAAIVFAVTVAVVGAVSPANAAEWKYKTFGGYSGSLTCFGAELTAQQNGWEILGAGCKVQSDGKLYFVARRWA